MSQLVNAEVNSGNRIKSGTRIKLRLKDSWTPPRIAERIMVASQQTFKNRVRPRSF